MGSACLSVRRVTASTTVATEATRCAARVRHGDDSKHLRVKVESKAAAEVQAFNIQ